MEKKIVQYVVAQDKDGNTRRVRVKELFFRPSVYGVIIKRRKILLAKQWDGYDFPGGGMELGESVNETLRREVWEETGLRVERGTVVACESSFYIPQFSKGYFHSILMYFLCRNVRGRISIKNFDGHEKQFASRAEWVSLTDTKRIKFINSVDSLEIIRKAIKVRSKS